MEPQAGDQTFITWHLGDFSDPNLMFREHKTNKCQEKSPNKTKQNPTPRHIIFKVHKEKKNQENILPIQWQT
jgi:hypothetical protein